MTDPVAWRHHVARYIAAKYGGDCPVCRTRLSYEPQVSGRRINPATRTRGHVFSVAHYTGPGAADHAQASWFYLCARCNSHQGPRTLEEWARSIPPSSTDKAELRERLLQLDSVVKAAIEDRVGRFGR